MRIQIVGCATLVLALAAPNATVRAQTAGGMDHSAHAMGNTAPAAMPAGQDA